MSLTASFPSRHRAKFSRTKDGCRTCRARRKKCDGRKPICLPCSRNHLTCNSPQVERTFPSVPPSDSTAGPVLWESEPDVSYEVQPRKPSLRDDVSYSAPNEPKQAVKLGTAHDEGTENDARADPDRANQHTNGQNISSLQCQQMSERSGKLRWQPTKSVDTLLSGISNNRVYSAQLLGQFLYQYTVAFQRENDSKDLSSFMWIVHHLPLLRGSGQTIDMGILALSSSGLGRQYNDMVLLKNATTAYVQALASLQRDINNQDKVARDETISACLTLILYQMLGEFPLEDWMIHVKGVGEIIRLRAPQTYSSGVAHELFLSCRVNIVLAELSLMEDTFLAEAAWCIEPWKMSPKSDYQQMVDCMTLLTGLRARSRRFNDIIDIAQKLDERLTLINHCWAVERRFQSWYNSLPAEFNPVYVFETGKYVSSKDVDSDPSTFPKSYKFSSFKIANMLMMYWASLIMLYNTLRYTYDALSGIEASYFAPSHPVALRCPTCFATFWSRASIDHPSHCTCGLIARQPIYPEALARLPRLTPSHDPKPLATHICMSLQYCLQLESTVLGPYYILFPLKMTIICFTAHLPATQAQLRWCYSIVEMLEKKGLLFSRTMLGMHNGQTFGGFGA